MEVRAYAYARYETALQIAWVAGAGAGAGSLAAVPLGTGSLIVAALSLAGLVGAWCTRSG